MDKKTDKEPEEMTKLGVVCHCSEGERPKGLEKTAEAGKLRCPYCGVSWLDLGTETITPQKQV